MKLPKFLLQTIAVAVATGMFVSCEQPEVLAPDNGLDNIVKDQPVKESPPETVPPDFNCPACGMG